jgi:hypothetical protein
VTSREAARRTTVTIVRAVARLAVGAAFVAAFVAACTGAVAPSASPTRSASSRPLGDAAQFKAALCGTFDELSIAYGNPDSGATSPAWDAMESAVKRGDPATIDAASLNVLAHLAAARAAISRGAGWQPGSKTAAQIDAALAALEAYVAAVRAARGEAAAAAAARTKLETEFAPLFLGFVQAGSELFSSGQLTGQVPCPSNEPR